MLDEYRPWTEEMAKKNIEKLKKIYDDIGSKRINKSNSSDKVD